MPNEDLIALTLARTPAAHWVWVNDFAFFNMADGRSYLVDADSARMLGMVNTGYNFNSVILPKNVNLVYSPETYYSRGTRGTRTDIVTIYDGVTLSPVSEISIPPKRSSSMPMFGSATLTDDDRFLLIYNFTPAQSVSVVDMTARKFVGEAETAGCGLIFPTGNRRFFSICGNGSLLDVALNDQGVEASATRTREFFDAGKDPITEKGVRMGNTWYFASYEGMLHPIAASAKSLEPGDAWPLFTAQELAQKWRIGGLQHLALHSASHRLYSVVHKGGPETHKDPGVDVWVYDLASHRKVQQIRLRNKVTSIQVTQDAKPLLVTTFIESNYVDIYDAMSGKYLRSVQGMGQTPTIIVSH